MALLSCDTASPEPQLTPTSQQRAASATMRPVKQVSRTVYRVTHPVVKVKGDPVPHVLMPVASAPRVVRREALADPPKVVQREREPARRVAALVAPKVVKKELRPSLSELIVPVEKEEPAEPPVTAEKTEPEAPPAAVASRLEYKEDGKVLDLDGKSYDVESFGDLKE